MKFYFDWQQFKIDSGGDLTAILILTFAVYRGYNNKLAWDEEQLRIMLTIDAIPSILTRQRYLIKSKYYEDYLIKYKIKKPTAYFINPDFMFSHCAVNEKVKYLYLLSHRRIADNANAIPVHHVKNQKLLNNPFIRVKDEKIIFIPETQPSNRRKYVEGI